MNLFKRATYSGVLVALIGVILLLPGCEELLNSTLEQGDRVVVKVEVINSLEDARGNNQSISDSVSIEEIELRFTSISITGKSGKDDLEFVISDSSLIFTPNLSKVELAEKIIPEGRYADLNLEMGNTISGVPAVLPGGQVPANRSNPNNQALVIRNGRQGLRSNDGTANPRPVPVADALNKARATVGGTASMKSSANPISVRVTGGFKGKSFDYRSDERLMHTLKMQPQLKIGKETDTLTVITLYFDYGQWFQGRGKRLMDPSKPDNHKSIRDNIQSSISLSRHNSRDNRGNGKGNRPGADPELRISDASAWERDKEIILDLVLSESSDDTISVGYSTSGNSAKPEEDYKPTSGTVTFLPGEQRHQLSVTLIDDQVAENDEFFTVWLSDPEGASLLPGKKKAKAKIFDRDSGKNGKNPKSGLNIIADESQESENNSPLNFKVRLSEKAEEEVKVSYRTSNNSAKSGQDYVTNEGIITFPAGDTVKLVSVDLLNDLEHEPDEKFTLQLLDPVGASITPQSKRIFGIILDDDNKRGGGPGAAPVIGISDASGNESSGPLQFTVGLSETVEDPVTVSYETKDQSAKAGDDYLAKSGTIRFNAGEQQKTIEIELVDDQVKESDEKFTVILSDPSNAGLDKNAKMGVGTIINDDQNNSKGGAIGPTIAVHDTSAVESGGIMVFRVSLSEASEETVQVNYTTADRAAKAGDDYEAAEGTVSFDPGEQEVFIEITLIDDTRQEQDQKFALLLSDPVNGELDNKAKTATGTIQDDD